MKKQKWMRSNQLDKHPSYGYANPEQIKQLEVLGMGPDRDKILKDIEDQNKNKGKIYYT